MEIAIGLKVMLQHNLCVNKGLTNGETGVIYDIIPENDSYPTSLPRAILIKFENYTGESFLP